MPQKKIAVLVGSLRKESFNRKIANALKEMAPASLSLDIVEIGDMPHYNEDTEANPPPSWTAFRERIKAADGVLFVTPEYNRSIPGVLKNAIDVGSRPYSESVWNGKPGAVVSASPGGMGAFGAAHILRQSTVALNILMMQQPEAHIANVAQIFDEQGRLAEKTGNFLKKFIDAYAAWVERLS